MAGTQRAYFDYAATAPVPERVQQAVLEGLRLTGNPASTHGHGQDAAALLEEARERVAAGLGASRAEVIFTGGGTESVNLGIKGLYWRRQRGGSRPIIVMARGEHHATIETCEWLAAQQGAQVVELPISGTGLISAHDLRECLTAAGPDRVALVTFLWVNNEVGTVQPVRELTAVAAQFGVPVHVDAVAALGQVPVDVAASGASAVSVSAHKVGGPTGVGALWLSRSCEIEALQHGGSQQRSRAGSQNVPGALGFAAALGLAVDEAALPLPERTAALLALQKRLFEGVLEAVPDAVLRGPALGEQRAPGNLNFTFPGCRGDALVYLLDAAGVSVSQGSACQAGVAEVSHVLLSMGVPEREAVGSLRLTFGAGTADWEVERLLEAVPGAVAAARRAGV